MIRRFSGLIFKYLLQTTIITVLYILMAQLGFLLALPPGNVTALWPPSGIALAAGLVMGYQVGLGVWLGSFIVNIGYLSGPAAPLVSAVIASGSTLQMFFGIWLLRRFIGLRTLQKETKSPDLITPTTPLEIMLFIGLTALAALVASTLGVSSLCIAGFAPWTSFFTLWLTWWMGDYAGILIIVPTAIVITRWLRKQATAEPIFFPLTSIWLGLSLIGFSFVWQADLASGHAIEPWGILLMGLSLSGIMIAHIAVRQRAEAAVRESEATIRLIMDNVPDAIITINTAGNIVLANTQATITFGYSHEELIGMPTEMLLPELARARHIEFRQAYFAHPTVRRMADHLNLYGKHKDEHEFPVEITISPIETSQGRLFMASIRDISERKYAEQQMSESEHTYRALFENANDAIFLLSLDGVNQQVNQKAADLLGYTREELIGMTTRDMIAAEAYSDSEHKIQALLQGLTLSSSECIFRKKDGQTLLTEVNLSMVHDANGKRKYIQSIVRDITERKNAIEQIHTLNATLEQRVLERTTELQKEITERKRIEEALQFSHDQLHHFVIELEQRNREVTLLGSLTEILESCNDINEAYQAITHHIPYLFPKDSGALYIISHARNLAENVSQWGKMPMDAAESAFAPTDCWALRRGREHNMESPLSDMLCKHVTETTPLPLPCSCIPMLAHGELLGVLHIRYSVPPGKETQIPDRKQLAITVAEQLALLLANLNLRETLRNQSIRDGLTGLFNRRYMEEAMTRELRRAERANRPLAVAILDLDHFKRFNDTFGHAAGDVALRAVSDVLKTKMRAGDIVCRYGGEEFVIIFIEMTLPNALSRMEGLRINIRQLEIEYLGTPLGQLTMSSGISAYPEYGNTPEDLLKAADDALYRAKQTGRDRVVVIPLDPENPESEEDAD